MAKQPQTAATDDDDTPPGDLASEAYQATGPRRGGGPVQFLWFVTADRRRDQIFPTADIRRMEPPDKPDHEVAYIHFSGVTAVLAGVHLRRVLQRIVMQRCVALYELRPGQARPGKEEAVIERMDFIDMTRAVPKVGRAD